MNTSPAPALPSPILNTDPALEAHVGALLDKAIQPQLWFMFLDSDNRRLPILMPGSNIPHYPDEGRDVRYLAEIFGGLFSHLQHPLAQLVVVIERPGRVFLTEADRCWVRTIQLAASVSNTRLRATLLCHDGGVRLVPPQE